ncbi:MAG: hypothetical protein C5B54_09190 [Acidobacteria bacterium]|nr:MAG: hypothetical protein C5B54_09190 [Acidobacteriota bacterium]
MRKIINLRDAQVSTATIEIKTLTVSNKQVTLAVFRQLIEQDLIAEGGNLNGVPWGLVNYHPDKCGEYNAHLHVVWQTGRDLRRSLVYLEPFYNQSLWVEEMNIAQNLVVRDYLMNRIDSYTVELEGTPVVIRPDGMSPYGWWYNRSSRACCVLESREKVKDYIDWVDQQEPRSFQKFLPILHAAVLGEMQRRKCWQDQVENLQNLPQLFIAV